MNADYQAQLARMLVQYRAWKSTHQNTPVLIAFRIPKKTFVIGSLDDALRNGFIVVDYAGKKMLKELGWLEDVPEMPTLAQVQAVIELENQKP